MRGIVAPLSVLLALAIVGAASLVWAERVMPDKVASHFGAEGKPDGWMPRDGYVQAMALIGFLMPASLLGIGLSMRVMPGSAINLPHREYWLSPERRAETNEYFARQFGWLACLSLALFVALNCLMIEGNRVSPPDLSNGVWVLLVLFLASTTILIVRLTRHFYRVPADRAV
jgi:Protein of unknown function (DUF1648)